MYVSYLPIRNVARNFSPPVVRLLLLAVVSRLAANAETNKYRISVGTDAH